MRSRIAWAAAFSLTLTLTTGATRQAERSDPWVPDDVAPCVGTATTCTAPRIVYEVRPEITAQAIAQKLQGLFVAQVVVSSDGSVEKARITRAPAACCFEAQESEILDVLRQWRFAPATFGGAAHKSLQTVVVSFAPPGGASAAALAAWVSGALYACNGGYAHDNAFRVQAADNIRESSEANPTITIVYSPACVPAKLLHLVKPRLTNEAAKAKVVGTVEVEAIVGVDGHVRGARVTRSLGGIGAGLNTEAIKAVEQWVFEPVRLNGTPVPAVIEVSAEFGSMVGVADESSPALPYTPGTRPFQPGSGITDPVLIREVKPNYTHDAMQAKLQGVVEMDVVVRPDGSVDPQSLRITRSLDATFGLDNEAKKAVRQWKFRPAVCNRDGGCGELKRGQPVAVLVSVELTFTLK